MKKLIYKTSFFVLPFLALYFITNQFYIKEQGDLFRLGYFSSNSGYNSDIMFQNETKRDFHYKKLSEIDLDSVQNFDILTIGDSFSETKNFAYQDYLGEKSGKSILHYDKFLHVNITNPIETVYSLLNSDFFDKVKVKYLLLESVERAYTKRTDELVKTNLITLDTIKRKIIENKNKEERKIKEKEKEQFFSRDLIRFPLYNLYYNFDDNAFYSPTYKVKANRNLFAVNKSDILFFDEDLDFIKKHCDNSKILKSNDEINKLNEILKSKGIQLILLVCPDKYDAYYNNILDKNRYPKPVFFETFNKLQKDYIYIDSKTLINKLIASDKDIYYYDDTHWSPKTAKAIGEEIQLKIK